METKTYLAGDKFSIADKMALCTMDFNKVNQITIAEEQTHLKSWYNDASSRPSEKFDMAGKLNIVK